jgi:hypothetical protein
VSGPVETHAPSWADTTAEEPLRDVGEARDSPRADRIRYVQANHLERIRKWDGWKLPEEWPAARALERLCWE